MRGSAGSLRSRQSNQIQFEVGPGLCGVPPILVSDSRKARELLGWVPRFPELKTQIAHARTWFRDAMPNIAGV
jgi:UDP-glucose 4-epimerase